MSSFPIRKSTNNTASRFEIEDIEMAASMNQIDESKQPVQQSTINRIRKSIQYIVYNHSNRPIARRSTAAPI